MLFSNGYLLGEAVMLLCALTPALILSHNNVETNRNISLQRNKEPQLKGACLWNILLSYGFEVLLFSLCVSYGTSEPHSYNCFQSRGVHANPFARREETSAQGDKH